MPFSHWTAPHPVPRTNNIKPLRTTKRHNCAPASDGLRRGRRDFSEDQCKGANAKMAEQQQRFSLITDKSRAGLRRSRTRWSRGATRRRVTTSATGPMASATTIRYGASLSMRQRRTPTPPRRPHHLRAQPLVQRLRRWLAGRVSDLRRCRCRVASPVAARRSVHDQGVAQGVGRASDPLRRARDPADLPLRILQSARRRGLRGR